MAEYKVRIDLTGQRFGKLSVLEFSHIERGYARWHCCCDCGENRIVSGIHLRSGHTKSCGGCLKRTRRELSPAELRTVFRYEPETGVLYWLESGKGRDVDLVAGTRQSGEHLRVQINYVLYGVHRVIWAMVHGEWPKDEIDHRDIVPSNNRISNLREATHGQNTVNRLPQAGTKSGIRGVDWSKQKRKWRVRIWHSSKDTAVGFCDTLEEAAALRASAAKKFYGEFARAA